MFPTRFKLAVVAALLALSSVSNAAIVRNLYTATVDVADQSASARKTVTADALAQVLVKVTGRENTRTDPSFSNMMSRSTRYVEQFRYVTEGRGEERKLKLRFKFDQRVIDRDLQNRNVAIWGAERPRNLVIAVVSTPEGRELVGSNSESDVAVQVREAIVAAGAARGVQLLFPLLDLADQTLLPVNEVWTGITTDYSELRSRYATDSVLIGRLELRPRELPQVDVAADEEVDQETVKLAPIYDGVSRWESWSGVISGQQWTHTDVKPLDAAADLGVGQLAGRYARLYAVGGAPSTSPDGVIVGNQGQLQVVVEGVNSYRDYQTVLKHIESRSVVKAVSVEQIDVRNLLLTVDLKGTAAQLDRAFALGKMLSPVGRYDQIQPTTDVDGNLIPPPLPPFPGAKYYAFEG